MFFKIMGILCFIAIIVTGITMPKTTPSLQILIGVLGFVCLLIGELTKDTSKGGH